MESGVANPVPEALRVGNGAGFWGDNLDAPYLLARDGRLDVLTLEYLAELTMAILSHQRTKDPSAGFVTDFPELVERLAPVLIEQPGLRIVTNAGGLNPPACAVHCARTHTGDELDHSLIGVVTGDDVLDRIPGWIDDRIDLGPPSRRASRSPASRGGWSRPMFISAPTRSRWGSARGRGSSSRDGWPMPR